MFNSIVNSEVTIFVKGNGNHSDDSARSGNLICESSISLYSQDAINVWPLAPHFNGTRKRSDFSDSSVHNLSPNVLMSMMSLIVLNQFSMMVNCAVAAERISDKLVLTCSPTFTWVTEVFLHSILRQTVNLLLWGLSRFHLGNIVPR